jgi:hypothetical protein
MHKESTVRKGKNAGMPEVLQELADCSHWSGFTDQNGAHPPNWVARSDRPHAIAGAEAYIDRRAARLTSST